MEKGKHRGHKNVEADNKGGKSRSGDGLGDRPNCFNHGA